LFTKAYRAEGKDQHQITGGKYGYFKGFSVSYRLLGEVAERLNAAVLKTVEG
jgi:hypothetical protein